MTILFLTVLFFCALGVLHTYVFYPAYVLRARAQRADNGGSISKVTAAGSSAAKNQRSPPQAAAQLKVKNLPGARPQVRGEVFESEDQWPPVTVLMAAHNEEAVIAAKLASLAAQDYAGALRFFVGSDNSSDATNDILTEWAAKDARLSPTLFTSRQGKPGIINQLAERAIADTSDELSSGYARPQDASDERRSISGRPGVFIITDASVMLRPDTITELVRPMLADGRIGVVDATMVQTGARDEGIGRQEEQYIHREVAVKRAEGELWGAMIGPFGGCWAIRAAAFRPVPATFLVDDFFLCMAAYEAGYQGVSAPAAIVEEGVGQSIRDEFRRKVRISSGNWQNLVRFRKLWWPFWKNPLAFAFFSHKVLRWWTPFLLLIGLAALAALSATLPGPGNYLPGLLLAIAVWGTAGLISLDVLLSAFGVHFGPARYLRYFLAMNAALLVGFYRYLTGIRSNVWQPSPRN